MIPFDLTRPWTLTLLLAALPVLWFFFVRSLSDFPTAQRKVSLGIRAVMVTMLALALAGLNLLHETDEPFFVFLIDESTSVSENGNDAANEFLDSALKTIGDRQMAFVPFASQPGAVRKSRLESESADPSSKQSESTASTEETDPSSGASELDFDEKEKRAAFRDGTNIAGAIESAAGYLPPGYVPHIVLLTDGNETVGDALAASTRSRIPITTVPLPTRSEPEVQVSGVNVPAEVREGEPFFVEVVVQSNHDDNAMVEVYRGDHKVIGETRKLKQGLSLIHI